MINVKSVLRRLCCILIASWFVVAVGAGMCLTTACGGRVILVSSYDDTTDKGLMALQLKADALLMSLDKTPTPDYSSAQGAYDEIRLDLGSLRSRNELRAKNEVTKKQLNLLKESLDKLESIHKAAQLNQPMVGVIHNEIDQNFSALLKLEIAKKEATE